MIYICIPAYNEAPTVGVLLWRIRKVFQTYAREYEIIVYDDGSTDATRETLVPYADVLPLTILGDTEHRGYAAAVEALVRAVATRTRYPRRDAMILMQGDFTEQPEDLPELVKRFEGGADVVVTQRDTPATAPVPVRRMHKVAPWVLKPFVAVPGVSDPFAVLRVYRISVLRDLLKQVGDARILDSDGCAANVELLLKVMPHARRIESVPLKPRYDVRPRESRVRPFADALKLYAFGRSARRLRTQQAS